MKGLAPLLLALTSVAAAIQVGWAQKSSRGFRPVIPRIWDDAAMAAILKALRPRTGLTLARVTPSPAATMPKLRGSAG